MSTRPPPTAPDSPIPVALAAVFAGIAVLTTMLALAYRTPVPLAVAAPFGLSASLVWYHATGRLHRRLRRGEVPGGRLGGRRERVGGGRAGDFGRGDAAGRGAGGRRAARSDGVGDFGRGDAGRGPWEAGRRRADPRGRDGRRSPPRDHAAPTREQALRTLDLEPGADADAVRAAYRRKVKEVHPDRGGDEAAFREVTEAYERLSGDESG